MTEICLIQCWALYFMYANFYKFNYKIAAIGICAALLGRISRFLVVHKYLILEWNENLHTVITNTEHIFSGIGTTALFVASFWHFNCFYKKEKEKIKYYIINIWNSHAILIIILISASLYIIHSFDKEFPKKEYVNLVNQFPYDLAGVFMYLCIMVIYLYGNYNESHNISA